MSSTVPIALFGILPVAVVLCGSLPARAGILATLLTGWLFLPEARLSVVGIPDYDKLVATNLAMLLGCLLFHAVPLLSVRPKWYDAPLALWCLAPSISSLTNDLGAYDALSVGVRQVLVWAIPYWVGRAYFCSADGLRDMATALVVGGLVYIPFCLFEVRMSPQLNDWVYGFHQNQFWRNIRFGGYRPVVFMQSGLMVGTWMAASTVVAYWFWVTGAKQRLSVPWPVVCAALLVTTVLCKALYAILLLVAAIALLTLLRRGRTVAPLVLLLLCVPGYMLVRASELASTETIGAAAEPIFGADRADSLTARLVQEDVLQRHVSDRIVFGWGGWSRSWPVDPYTGEYSLRGLDGLWTIVLGENGLYGLFTMFAMLLLPVIVVLARFGAEDLSRVEYGSTAALAVCLLLFACDCLLNGMLNPFYIVVAGGLSGLPAPATDENHAPQLAPAYVFGARRLQWSRSALGGMRGPEGDHG